MSTQQLLQRLFWLCLSLFLVTTLVLGMLDASLRTDAMPYGIVSFEFCGFTQSCEAGLVSWGRDGQAIALLLQSIDYLYLILYPGLIALSILRLRGTAQLLSSRLTSAALLACPVISVADAIENYALIRIILDGAQGIYGTLGSVFATIKFAALAFAFVWLLVMATRAIALRKPSDQ